MLMKLTHVLCAVIISQCVFFTTGAKLPKVINKCRKDDPNLGDCIVKSGNEAVKHLLDGNNNIRFPSLRPLKVPFMQVNVGEGLKLNLTNSEIYGLENLHIDRVKVDMNAKKYTFEITNPRFQHLGYYNITGKILILPIYGHGPINTTFINSHIKFSFEYDIEEKNGKGYMVPKNPVYVIESERVYYKLDNLFNGNDQLSKEMNIFLDENWKEVNDELGPRLGDVIGELFTGIIKGFAGRVAYDDLFAKP